MTDSFKLVSRAAIRAILENPDGFVWTVQGMGMLRTYLDADKQWRLNIWDCRLRYPGVSTIHDHPWHFRSYILSGCIRNQRYDFMTSYVAPTHEFMAIETGEDGGPKTDPKHCVLKPLPLETYFAGNEYFQQRDMVHETFPEIGTVTLNDRTQPDAAHEARVFWRPGDEWVDAKPRLATEAEILKSTTLALARWHQ